MRTVHDNILIKNP